MKKTTQRKALILSSLGLFAIATTQMLSHFVEVNDLAKGSFIGIGIGLLLTSLIFINANPVRH